MTKYYKYKTSAIRPRFIEVAQEEYGFWLQALKNRMDWFVIMAVDWMKCL